MNRPAYGEQTSLSWRKRRAGQRLVIGLPGASPSDDLRAFAREAVPGGFVLFKHNVEEPAQVRELNRELASLLPASHPPLLSVDQEGGRVQRVRATEWPRARWVGNVDSPSRTFDLGVAMADELRALGFNANWAPDCDVDSNPKNPVIGDRAYSSTAAGVARHATAVIRAFHSRGLIACAKHFPGHGDTSQDSHLELPTVEKEAPDLQQMELAPFRAAIAAGVEVIMTSHVVFPAWDEHFPATLSSPILRGVLREDLGFSGVIVSDDLEMKAVRGRFPLEQQLDLAARATCDLFLVCHELDMAWEAYEILVRLQEADKVHDDLATDTERRLLRLRERFLKSPPAAPDLAVVGSVAHRALAERFRAEGMG